MHSLRIELLPLLSSVLTVFTLSVYTVTSTIENISTIFNSNVYIIVALCGEQEQ